MSNDATLQNLYPGMRKTTEAPADLNARLVDSVRTKVHAHREVVDQFFDANGEELVAVAASLASSYRHGGRLFTMGNGGSSCDAAHLAVEFLHPVTAGRPALPAVDLSADRAMLSAVGNDVGFEHVFARQLIALAHEGDCLIGFSTSGSSANLTRAFRRAKEMQLVTVGMAGKSGGEMIAMGLDHCLLVETDSIHRIQECHLIAYHVLWDLVHTMLAGDREAAGGQRVRREASRP